MEIHDFERFFVSLPGARSLCENSRFSLRVDCCRLCEGGDRSGPKFIRSKPTPSEAPPAAGPLRSSSGRLGRRTFSHFINSPLIFLDRLIRSIYRNSKNANPRKTSDSKVNAFAPSRSRSRFGWEMYSRLERSEGPFVQHV